MLAEAEGRRRAILIATGSEVEIALAARAILQAKGIGTRVVSMPCWELFAAQDEKYRRSVLPAGSGAGRRSRRRSASAGTAGSAASAASEKKAGFVGMTGFGASGPIEALYPHFGITAEAVAAKAEALL